MDHNKSLKVSFNLSEHRLRKTKGEEEQYVDTQELRRRELKWESKKKFRLGCEECEN